MVNYKIQIVTGSMKDAGTNANVYLTAEGTNGSMTWANLDNPKKDDFEQGNVDTFTVSSARDLGDINKITIGHDNSGKHAGWFVSSVQIKNVSTGKTWTFFTNRWLARDEADHKLSATFTLNNGTPAANYKIIIFTGEAKDSGTNANVYLKAYGSNGSFSLNNINDPNDDNDFEAGNVNTVVYSASKDIGDISQITIGHDNSGKHPGWYLDGVKIQNLRTGKVWNFPVYRWLAKDEDDKKIERTVYAGKDMPHYDYLGMYPKKDREPGWSNELNGICHDASNWYMTQDGNIWKFPVSFDLNTTIKNEDKTRKVYKYHYGHHLGDCDCFNNYLFVPVTDDGAPYVVVFSTNDIHKVIARNVMLLPDGRSFSDMAWVAINPKNGLLFTSDGYITKNKPIYVYSIDFEMIRLGKNNFLKLHAQVNLKDEEFDDYVERSCMQGGCFDDSNNLHLCNGYYKNEHSNKKGGITVFEIPNLPYKPNDEVLVKIKARSNQSHDFRFQFNSYGQEPEGLTYWDLDDGKAPGIRGQLHAIMIENNAVSDAFNGGGDDLYFKHYRKI
ncbi:PLAT/LH2 domain-containing protein [Fibrobacter sp. UWB11]|uniref:PLAT/LH2 domain-containing protein n=1 Tax=Fibrobacter sp. UWB11 TaxID=1896202 RepID=UPI0009284DF8|nr:PLAT/LH2 domain-containing protein [Fibrobacter sp. UWB11]SIN96148.1 PLAT/LH2 domain-containing protein [Fibrobacter sp. UWB11]